MASRYRFRRAFGNVNSKFRGARRDTYPLETVLTESDFDNLTYYENTTYKVTDWGTYEGSELVSYESFNPGADDIHVKTTGNDTTGDGTEENPFANIARALKKNVLDGTTHRVWLHAGTYAQDEFINGTNGSIGVGGQGRLRIINLNPSSEIIISAVPSDVVTLTCTDVRGLVDTEGDCGNLTFKGFVLAPVAGAPEFDMSSGTCSNFKITDCVSTTGSGIRSIYWNAVGSNLRVLRNTFTNAASTRNIDLRQINGARIIGNTITGNASNISIRPFSAVQGSHYYNQNTLTGGQGIIQEAAIDSAGLSYEIIGNEFTGDFSGFTFAGGSATNPIAFKVDDNVVNAGRTGIKIANYATISTINGNTVRAGLNGTGGGGDTGLGFPSDGALSGLVEVGTVSGNDVNSENGHAAIVGELGSGATVTNNTFGGANSFDYGFVVKGTGHTITGNTFKSGDSAALYLKGCDNSTVTGNIIQEEVACPLGVLRTNAGDGSTFNMTLRDNTVIATASPALGIASVDLGTGYDTNDTTYDISGTATWGSVLETNVTSLATLQAAWSGYDVPTNDSNSTEAYEPTTAWDDNQLWNDLNNWED